MQRRNVSILEQIHEGQLRQIRKRRCRPSPSGRIFGFLGTQCNDDISLPHKLGTVHHCRICRRDIVVVVAVVDLAFERSRRSCRCHGNENNIRTLLYGTRPLFVFSRLRRPPLATLMAGVYEDLEQAVSLAKVLTSYSRTNFPIADEEPSPE